MKLYFKNSRGDKRLITEPNTEEEAFKEIHKFLDEHNFKSYYTRIWQSPDGAKVYDVGSHTEFFYLYN